MNRHNSIPLSWTKKVAGRILPLSADKNDLAAAMQEWQYTGHCTEAENNDESCELCGHHPIRYMFEIRNFTTDSRLWVGSECITRFGISGSDDQGQTLDAAATKSKLSSDRRKMIEDAKERRAIANLIKLAAKDHDFNIDNFIGYLKKRGAFTPKQMLLLNWRFKKNRIAHNPSDFKVALRRNREKQQILDMEEWKLTALLPYLTAKQIDRIFDNH